MKAILFTTQAEAKKALARCNKEIPVGKAVKIVDGEEVELSKEDSPASKPYSVIINHPSGAGFALLSDSAMEALLGAAGEELGADWFVRPEKKEG